MKRAQCCVSSFSGAIFSRAEQVMLKRVILWAMLTSLAGAAGAQMSLPQLGSGLGTALGRVDSALSR
jgi:cation transporter-like permease